MGPLREACQRLRVSVRQVSERQRLEDGGRVAPHCLACGQDLALQNRFCGTCGTSRPLDVECPACGSTTRLPKHLLCPEWTQRTLYCAACGAQMPPIEGKEPVEGRANRA